MSDLERRVRRLEGLLPGLDAAARRVEFTARAASGSLRLGSGRAGGDPPSTGAGGDSPCCPGVPAPATLTARFPGGQTATLTYAAGTRDWSGSVTLPDAQVRTGFFSFAQRCGYDQFGAAVNESYTFDLRASCAAGDSGGAASFRLVGIAHFGFRAAFGSVSADSPAIVRPYSVPSPTETCRTIAFAFGAAINPGQCSPFNVALSLTANPLPLLGVPLSFGQQVIVYA